MRRALPLALLLPLLLLAAAILRQERARLGAEEWRIAVEGFDPRDTIRGLYVRFSYAFVVRGDPKPCLGDRGCQLCLSREGGEVVATVATAPGQCRLAVDTLASHIDVRPGPVPGSVRFSNRIFVSETSAPPLRRQLAAGRMQLLAGLGADGRLVSRRLEPLSAVEQRPVGSAEAETPDKGAKDDEHGRNAERHVPDFRQ